VNILGRSWPGKSSRARYPEASSERTVTVSPGSTVRTGAWSREKTSLVVPGVGSSR
jgi:hypothetical protein